jgi:hypothetical protein
MNTLKTLTAAAALLLVAGTAHAEMPNYNVQASCTEVAELTGAFSETLMQGCLKMEQSAYNALKPTWDSLPAEMRTSCTEVAEITGHGSYSLLHGCVKMEQSASRKNQQFQFQR